MKQELISTSGYYRTRVIGVTRLSIGGIQLAPGTCSRCDGRMQHNTKTAVQEASRRLDELGY